MEKRKDFEERMTKTYPLLYEDMYGDPRQTIMAFGFDIGPGWYSIIEELSSKLEKIIEPIRDEEVVNPEAMCSQCGRGKKWHGLFYIICAIKYFFMNKWKVIKQLPREIKKARKFKTSIWKRVKFILLNYYWHKACKRLRLQHPRAMQVKEKFGGLRFYMTWETDEIDALISEAESKSYITCEECGKPGKRRNNGWITTLCDECVKKSGKMV